MRFVKVLPSRAGRLKRGSKNYTEGGGQGMGVQNSALLRG